MFNMDDEELRKLLLDFKERRLEQVEAQFDSLDEIAELYGRLRAAGDSIEQNLNENSRKDFVGYEDISNEILAQCQPYFYEQGLFDCIKVMRIIFSGIV